MNGITSPFQSPSSAQADSWLIQRFDIDSFKQQASLGSNHDHSPNQKSSSQTHLQPTESQNNFFRSRSLCMHTMHSDAWRIPGQKRNFKGALSIFSHLALCLRILRVSPMDHKKHCECGKTKRVYGDVGKLDSAKRHLSRLYSIYYSIRRIIRMETFAHRSLLSLHSPAAPFRETNAPQTPKTPSHIKPFLLLSRDAYQP